MQKSLPTETENLYYDWLFWPIEEPSNYNLSVVSNHTEGFSRLLIQQRNHQHMDAWQLVVVLVEMWQFRFQISQRSRNLLVKYLVNRKRVFIGKHENLISIKFK